MTRAFWLTACLGLAACDKASPNLKPDNRRSEQQQEALQTEPKAYSARMSCRAGGSYVGISACLVAGVGAPDGELKIRSGDTVRHYTGPDIVALERQALGPIVTVDLQTPFQITAQSAGEDRYVLRVDLLAQGSVISSDETSGYGALVLENPSLE